MGRFLTIENKTSLSNANFFSGQPSSGGRVVGQDENGNNRYKDGHTAFNNEKPSPSSNTTGTVQTIDNTIGLEKCYLMRIHRNSYYDEVLTMRPPKAPETILPQYKIDMRLANSCFLYQEDSKNRQPGKKPASTIPKKNRIARRPE